MLTPWLLSVVVSSLLASIAKRNFLIGSIIDYVFLRFVAIV